MPGIRRQGRLELFELFQEPGIGLLAVPQDLPRRVAFGQQLGALHQAVVGAGVLARPEGRFEQAERLPEAMQESLASIILQEIEDERGWDERFAATQDQLGELARRARAEVAEEGALPYDPSNRPE